MTRRETRYVAATLAAALLSLVLQRADAVVYYDNGGLGGAMSVTTTVTSGTNPAFIIRDGKDGDANVPTQVTITGESGQLRGFHGAEFDAIYVYGSSSLIVDPGGPEGSLGVGIPMRCDFGETAGGAGDLLYLYENASAEINGLVRMTETGAGKLYGVTLFDTSTFILGPTGDIRLDETGGVNTNHGCLALVLSGAGAKATLQGNIAITETHEGHVNLAIINAGTVNITSGTYSLYESGPNNLTPFVVGDDDANSAAILNISGGSFTFSENDAGNLLNSTIAGDGAVTLFSDECGFTVNGVAITSTIMLHSTDIVGGAAAGVFDIQLGTLRNGGDASALDFTVSSTGTLTLNVLELDVAGDTNGDRVVDAADFITFKAHFGRATSAGAADGDFDKNGTVEWDDLQTLMSGIKADAAGETIPEPGAAALLVLGGGWLLRRKVPSGVEGRRRRVSG